VVPTVEDGMFANSFYKSWLTHKCCSNHFEDNYPAVWRSSLFITFRGIKVIGSDQSQMLKAAIRKVSAKLSLKLGSSKNSCLKSTLSDPILTMDVHGKWMIPRVCRNCWLLVSCFNTYYPYMTYECNMKGRNDSPVVTTQSTG
jgi:hypothetical protein